MRNIDDYTKKYSVHSFEDYQVKYRRKKVLEQIQYFAPQSILEIGVGSEPLFQYVENVKFTIVEPSDEFYKNAKELGGESVYCIHGFFEQVVDQLNKEYDMIICSSVLHEVEFPDKLFGAITQICKENTIIHVNVPNADSMHRLIALESGIIADKYDMSQRNSALQQHNVFDLKKLIQLAENNGMHVVDQGSYFVKPFTHEEMFFMLKEGAVEERVLDGLYNIEKYMPGLGSEIFINCRLKK